MRDVKRTLLVALVLAGIVGCSSSRTPETDDRKAEPEAPPRGAKEEKAPDRIVVQHPGSTRAWIYTWREKFPRELPPHWILGDATYVRTDDFANAWKLQYVTANGERELRVAAAEYGSNEAAKLQIDEAERAIAARGTPSKLSPPAGAERACAGFVEGTAVAAILSGRYLFTFGAPVSSEVGGDAVRGFVAACFAEEKRD